MNKNIKDIFMDIENKEGYTETDILNMYNLKHKKSITKQSFNRTLNNNNIKYNMLIDILDSIGYCVEIKKKL